MLCPAVPEVTAELLSLGFTPSSARCKVDPLLAPLPGERAEWDQAVCVSCGDLPSHHITFPTIRRLTAFVVLLCTKQSQIVRSVCIVVRAQFYPTPTPVAPPLPCPSVLRRCGSPYRGWYTPQLAGAKVPCG